MTKSRYKHTWLMGILLATLTLTSPPTPAVGPLIGILVEIGKGVLTEVVLDMLEDEPGKDTEVQANPDQLDAAQQAKLVLKAAKQGDAKAQFAMAIIFYEGLGVSKNEEQAVSWMTKSASQGFAKAQFGLGLMYESGIGVNLDNEQAVEWYLKAADQGFAEAQFNLGTMYSSGLGVDRNPILAYQWFSLAANQGHQNAKPEQASLRQQLSLQEVNEANRLTKHWLAEHNGRVARSESPKTGLSMSSESEDDSKSYASNSVPPSSTEKWLVILGTYPKNQRGKAQQRLNLLENSGYHDASIEESDNYPNLKKGLFIVVRGPFSKNQAESVKEEMSAVIPDVYIKLDGR